MCGNAVLEPGEQCDDGNTRDGDGCSSKCRKEAAGGAPASVEPSALQAHQLSSNTDVLNSKRIRDLMIRNHVTSLRAVLRLCVDPTGLVAESTLIERTGYPEYDGKLVEASRGWQYRPFLINGVPTPVCSTVEFLYSPQ